MKEVFQFTSGSTPVLISVPHAGTEIPAEVAARMTGEASLPRAMARAVRADSLSSGRELLVHGRRYLGSTGRGRNDRISRDSANPRSLTHRAGTGADRERFFAAVTGSDVT